MNVPSKRQPSKQRRAAQNRASRAEREARSQRAGELRASAPGPAEEAADEAADSTSASSPIGGSGSLFGGLFGGGGAARGGGERPVRPKPTPQPVSGKGLVATRPDGTRLPGALAAFIAGILAIAAFAFMLVMPLVEVDDRDETLPLNFQGLYMETRELLEGHPVETESVTLIQANGPAIIFVLAVPLAIVLYAWWMHRKTGLSRPLTIGMVAMAVGVLFLSSIAQSYIPALIAMAVGSFQARKAELPARMAERAQRAGTRDDDEVIDVDSVEEEYDEDEYDEDEDEDEDFEYVEDEDEDFEYVEDEYDEDEYEDDEDLDEEDVADEDEDFEDEYDEDEELDDEDVEDEEDVLEDEDEDVKR